MAWEVDTCAVARHWRASDRRRLARIEQQLAVEDPAMAGMFNCWLSTCEQQVEQPERSADTEVPVWVAAVLLVGMMTWICGSAVAVVVCMFGGLTWLLCREPRRPNGDGPPPGDGDWPAGYSI